MLLPCENCYERRHHFCLRGKCPCWCRKPDCVSGECGGLCGKCKNTYFRFRIWR